jgi:hypothetical protein
MSFLISALCLLAVDPVSVNILASQYAAKDGTLFLTDQFLSVKGVYSDGTVFNVSKLSAGDEQITIRKIGETGLQEYYKLGTGKYTIPTPKPFRYWNREELIKFDQPVKTWEGQLLRHSIFYVLKKQSYGGLDIETVIGYLVGAHHLKVYERREFREKGVLVSADELQPTAISFKEPDPQYINGLLGRPETKPSIVFLESMAVRYPGLKCPTCLLEGKKQLDERWARGQAK